VKTKKTRTKNQDAKNRLKEPRIQDAKNQRKNTKEIQRKPNRFQAINFKWSPKFGDYLEFCFFCILSLILGFLLPLFFGSWHLGSWIFISASWFPGSWY